MNGNNEKIGYKVVRVVNKSGTVFKPATKFALQRIRYRIGQWTERNNCGSFCLFETYRDACSFWLSCCMGAKDTAILECKYIRTRKANLRDELGRKVFVWKKRAGIHRTSDDYIPLKDNRNRQYVIPRAVQIPKGTVFADCVFPIKIVKRS